MTKFKRGWVYIVYSLRYGQHYIVRQKSQRTWVASAFTTLNVRGIPILLSSNSKNLFEDLSVGTAKGFRENNVYNEEYRKCLFNILKYGKFEE